MCGVRLAGFVAGRVSMRAMGISPSMPGCGSVLEEWIGVGVEGWSVMEVARWPGEVCPMVGKPARDMGR